MNENQSQLMNRLSSTDPSPTKKSVLFLCKANICRSPAAESVFRQYLDKQQGSNILVSSAGVNVHEDGDGVRPSFAMRWVAYRRGYKFKQLVRRVLPRDLNDFDLIIAMDRSNRDSLLLLSSSQKSPVKASLNLLSDFLPRRRWPIDVPDPMNRSQRTCHRVFDMLEAACPKIFETLAGTPIKRSQNNGGSSKKSPLPSRA